MLIINELSKMKKIRTAILISGRGSNMESLIKACQAANFPATINLVIADRNSALGVKIAGDYGIDNSVIDYKKFAKREDFEKEIAKKIDSYNCQIICLAGFMRVLSAWFVNRYQGRIINIHPSLLPAFKGANAVEDAFLAKVQYSGCSTHFVSEEIDSGKIIKQARVKIKRGDSLEEVKMKILAKEHIIYPQTLKKVSRLFLSDEINDF